MNKIFKHLIYQNVNIQNPKYVVQLEIDKKIFEFGFFCLSSSEIINELYYKARMLSGSSIEGETMNKVKITIFNKNNELLLTTYANYLC